LANEVLARQAQAHAKQTGEAFEDALEGVLKTVAGRQLRELRDGPHGCKIASQWQGDLIRGRRRERVQSAWKLFKLMEAEQRELELQKKKTTSLSPIENRVFREEGLSTFSPRVHPRRYKDL
jgi:hypothetical protein